MTKSDSKTCKSLRHIVYFMLLVILCMLAAFLWLGTYIYKATDGHPERLLQPSAERHDVTIDIESLTERVITLEQSIHTLENTLPFAHQTEQNHQNEASIDADTITVETEQPSSASIAPNTQPHNIAAHIRLLESQVETLSDQLIATEEKHDITSLILATVALRDAALESRPFTQELAAVNTHADTFPRVRDYTARLAPYSKQGAPSQDQLKLLFAERLDTALTSIHNAKTSPSTFEKLTNQFSSVVSIRKVDGDTNDHSPEALIARAERWIAKDDISSALSEISNISLPEAQAAFQPWTKQAQQWVNIHNTIDSLFDEVDQLNNTDL